MPAHGAGAVVGGGEHPAEVLGVVRQLPEHVHDVREDLQQLMHREVPERRLHVVAMQDLPGQ